MSNDLFKTFMQLEDSDPSTREQIVRAPFGWPGAKTRCYSQIIPHLPYRRSWNDVCGGSGIMTLVRQPSDNDTYNDKHSGVTTFYRVLKDDAKFGRLCDWINNACHSREEFLWCRDTWKNPEDDVERAARWFYSIIMSFSQLGRNFARATNGKMCHPQMLRNKLSILWKVKDRFQRVQIENLDLFDFIKDYCDKTGAVNYYDPDYIGVYQCYEHSIGGLAAHAKLCDFIMGSRGFHCLSGRANDIYDSYQWTQRITFAHRESMEGFQSSESSHKAVKSDKHTEVTEVLWIKDND